MDRQKIIRILRLCLTCILLFFITWYYQVPESSWGLITIWFVMFEYSTVGGVYTKSFLRFAGTGLSALYGIIIIYFCSNNPVINALALIPGIFIYSYYFMGGEKTYIGTIGAVTLTIALLNYNKIDLALLRIFNVIIGILASMFMMRFFFPQYARDRLIEVQINLIKQLSCPIKDYLNPGRSLSSVKVAMVEGEKKILENISLFARYLSESKIETKKTPNFIIHNAAALNHIRKIFRLISVFICNIATDTIRSDEIVSYKIHQILLSFQNILRQMDCNESMDIFNIDAIPDECMEFVKVLLEDISNEIALLDNEVKQILEIYRTYNVKYVAVIE